MSSFKECHDRVLKPKAKYTGKDQVVFDRFYKDGGYDFLINLELTYDNCGSICDPPLFYITRDISEGLPTKDCLTVSIEYQNLKTVEIVKRLDYMYYVVIVSSGLPLFLLCGYNKSLDRLK